MKFIVQFESNQEKLDIFQEVISNYALESLGTYGLKIKIPKYPQYRELYAKRNGTEIISITDVIMYAIKDGGCIQFTDIESDGEYNRTLTIDSIISGMDNVPSYLIKQVADETHDTNTCDHILQYILFSEIIFC